MARKALIKKAKKPVARLGKSVVASMNKKAYGEEYVFDHPIDNREAGLAFSWYSINCDNKQASSFMIDYLTDNDRKEEADALRKISDNRIYGYGSTACWVARIFSMGYEFEDHERYSNLLNNSVTKIIEADARLNAENDHPKFEDKKGPRISLVRNHAERQFDQYLEILNEVFDAVDINRTGKFNPNFSINERIKDMEIDPKHLKDMLSELKNLRQDAVDLIEEKDPDELLRIKSFIPITKKKLVYIDELINELMGEASLAPKERKPRKKKPISIDKLISHIKYQPKDDELGLVSFDPKKIIGASEIWVYNTKYSNLTVYRSLNETGLSIKGTTLLNFDEDKSVSKKVGRVAKKITNDVVQAGKIQLRKQMDMIKATPSKPNGRINENTILLRVG